MLITIQLRNFLVFPSRFKTSENLVV